MVDPSETFHYTIVDGGPGVMAKIFGVFGTIMQGGQR